MVDLFPVGVALGSNQGDRLGHLRAALSYLETISKDPVRYSCVYETKPIGCPKGSPSFFNAVCEITYQKDPSALLRLLREMREFEKQQGRPETYQKNTPRPLDMDLLYAGDLILQTEELTLPHPRMLERRFVLQPLCEIRPDLILPGSRQTVKTLLALLDDAGDVRLYKNTLQ